MKTEQLNKIKIHGENLNVIFHTGREPVALCKALRKLERKGDKIARDWCNGVITQQQYEAQDSNLEDSLDSILNFRKQGIPVFTNGDPRGYILKIKEDYIRENNLEIHTDWGGYGIIAPEIN